MSQSIESFIEKAKSAHGDQAALESIYAEMKALEPDNIVDTFVEFQQGLDALIRREKREREEEILAATLKHETEGRAFWRQVYAATIRTGSDSTSAKVMADVALEKFNAAFPVQI